VLVFGLIDNYWLFDLGLRSATVKYTAHYRATGEWHKINELLNTGMVYFSAVAVLLLFAAVYLARHVESFFRVSPGFRPAFAFLVVLTGASWAIGMVFNVFNACLEGFQYFDLSSRIWISSTVVRVVGMAVLLWLGYGLYALGILVVVSQFLGYALSFAAVRRVFPAHRFAPRMAKYSSFKLMAGYGIHTMTGAVAGQLLNQSAPLLIGHFLNASFVAFFNVPVRLLQYTADAVDRVGLITSSNAAELTAHGDTDAISRLGIFVNRYCLTLFLPAAVFLLFYGRQVIAAWIRKPDFVALSAPLLPALVLGTTFAIAAQVNSSSILYGLARHGGYARGLLAEGIALGVSLYFIVPRFGIGGAAWTVSALMIADRGLFTPWLLCRHLKFSFAVYMRSIYVRPMLTAVPAAALAFWLRSGVLPGNSLIQVLAAASAVAAVHFALAYFTCLEPQHRAVLWSRILRRGAAAEQIGEAA
jgi:O-antigen/teichoic acid export membrane protein